MNRGIRTTKSMSKYRRNS